MSLVRAQASAPSLYELMQEVVSIHTSSCMEEYKMDQAPRLMDDDPMPTSKRTYVQETSYSQPFSYGGSAEPEIGGEIKVEESDDPYINKSKWKNRRQMAWISLFALIGQVLASLAIIAFTDVTVERMKVLVELMSWPALAFASVIGAYMGFTTWAGRK